MKRQTAPKWKASALQQMVEAIMSNPVIGVAKISGIPGPQMQTMRHTLRGDLGIQVVKNNLMALALQASAKEKPGLDALIASIEGQSALITSRMNAFKLYRVLSDAKTKAPAKGGEIAPEDLEVKAGETQFKPGPIVGELQKAGIPAAIEEGKVVVKKDKLLVNAGEEIPKAVAEALTKLGIYPLTVGMDLLAAYEDGTVFKRNVLAIDQGRLVSDMGRAVGRALALAIELAYPTEQTIRPLILRARISALGLALSTGTVTKESAPILLSRARAQMLALASRMNYGKEVKEMEYIYSALVLYSAGRHVTEEGIANVLKAAGVEPDPTRVKALAAALEGVNIEEVIASAALVPSAALASAVAGEGEKKPEKKEEKKEEKVSEEESAAGLGALFG